MTYSGLYTALVTPFKNDELDQEGLTQLLSYQNEAQVDGVVLLGTTGESPTVTLDEKMKILKIARQSLNKTKMIVGAGTASTRSTIEMAALAEFEGADALLIVTPYYNKPNQEGIFRHFQEVARSTSLPIIAYSIASRCSISIEIETLKRLIDIPNIVGIKDCSKNLTHIEEMLTLSKENKPEFVVLSGDDSFTFPIMTLGGHGLISTASNVNPKKMKRFVDCLAKNDLVESRKLHFELIPLFNALSIDTNPIPIKAALDFFGLPAGSPRLPLTPLDLNKQKRLYAILEQYK